MSTLEGQLRVYDVSFSLWQLQLTGGSQEEKDQDPVDPEEQEGKEGDKGLQGEEGEVDEDFSCHVEQSDGQSYSFPHEEHQQQEDDLETKHTVSLGFKTPTDHTFSALFDDEYIQWIQWQQRHRQAAPVHYLWWPPPPPSLPSAL